MAAVVVRGCTARCRVREFGTGREKWPALPRPHTGRDNQDVGAFSVATTPGVSSSPPGTATTDNVGMMNWSGNCDLPSGAYSFIKLLVKDDASPWSTHLMEKTQSMFFTIP